jgi:hypothetical protein
MEERMAQLTPDPWVWAISRRGNSRYARAALVGGVLPVVLALVNQRLVGRMVVGYETGPTVLACAAMLAEIAVVGWLCAKILEPARARWLAYLWMWVLLDLMVEPWIVDGIWWGHPMALLAPALLSVQLLLVAMWAVFGTTRRSIRWPATAALLMLGVGVCVAPHAYGARKIAWLVAAQTMVFLAACVLLYWRGNRIRVVGFGDVRGASPAAETGKTQFFMRDLLVWTTLTALLLALARAFDLLSLPSLWLLEEHEVALMCLTGALSGLVQAAAASAVLGLEAAVLRWGRLAAMAVLAIVSVGVCFYFNISWAWRWGYQPASEWHPLLRLEFWELFLGIKWHLLALMGLSAAMLMASLVFLRAQGYRLGREVREW